ncbi:metal-dependent hydrolase [Candidatus Desantisbacteria bacterium]|nr:metal-dependent hydrolase [Candidatus Desantisbacteria bacterium]
MPTPIGHTLTAAIIHTIIRKRKQQGWICLLFCIIFSSLPDIDFISITNSSLSQEWVSGGLSLPWVRLSWENHHGPTHSLGFVILIMLVVGIVARMFQRDWRKWGIISGICVTSHVLMDIFIVKKGLMLFYPLSTHRIIMATGFPFGYSPEMGFVSFVVMSAVEEMVILGSILIIVWKRIK